MKSYVEHLQVSHDIKLEFKELRFADYGSFMKWKEDEELHCKASYVQKTGAKTYGQRKYWYFYCNRSGSYQARGKGERLINHLYTRLILDSC